MLAWPEWKDENGQFSMERFRAFSSMNNGKGLPEQEEVKVVLAWPEWKDKMTSSVWRGSVKACPNRRR